jgi:hypothetical protein
VKSLTWGPQTTHFRNVIRETAGEHLSYPCGVHAGAVLQWVSAAALCWEQPKYHRIGTPRALGTSIVQGKISVLAFRKANATFVSWRTPGTCRSHDDDDEKEEIVVN